MKGKFKKFLTINIAEDGDDSSSNQRNQHQEASKQHPIANPLCLTNEDEDDQDQEQLAYQERSNETAAKQGFSHFDPESTSQSDRHSKNLNMIEFQEFTVEKQTEQKSIAHFHEPKATMVDPKGTSQRYPKKQRPFSIEIPEEEHCYKKDHSSKFVQEIEKKRNLSIKEPPAPSNKQKAKKSEYRNFVFPTTDQVQESKWNHSHKDPINSNKGDEITKQKLAELNNEWKGKVEELNRSFQKQRQQFYKQKSNLDGQIQMLQKLITSRYSPKQSEGSNFSNQDPIFTEQKCNIYRRSSHYVKNSRENFPPHSRAFQNELSASEKLESLEAILNEKDAQIDELLQKINDLSLKLESKATENESLKIDILKYEKLNESLRNELFIRGQREESQNLTKKFNQIKGNPISRPYISKTPKNQGHLMGDSFLEHKSKEKESYDYTGVSLRGIDDLHRRLESLKMNRMELESRGKIKSQITCSQTSKHKPKGMFDFKGKLYDRDRDFANHSRLY